MHLSPKQLYRKYKGSLWLLSWSLGLFYFGCGQVQPTSPDGFRVKQTRGDGCNSGVSPNPTSTPIPVATPTPWPAPPEIKELKVSQKVGNRVTLEWLPADGVSADALKEVKYKVSLSNLQGVFETQHTVKTRIEMEINTQKYGETIKATVEPLYSDDRNAIPAFQKQVDLKLETGLLTADTLTIANGYFEKLRYIADPTVQNLAPDLVPKVSNDQRFNSRYMRLVAFQKASNTPGHYQVKLTGKIFQKSSQKMVAGSITKEIKASASQAIYYLPFFMYKPSTLSLNEDLLLSEEPYTLEVSAWSGSSQSAPGNKLNSYSTQIKEWSEHPALDPKQPGYESLEAQLYYGVGNVLNWESPQDARFGALSSEPNSYDVSFRSEDNLACIESVIRVLSTDKTFRDNNKSIGFLGERDIPNLKTLPVSGSPFSTPQNPVKISFDYSSPTNAYPPEFEVYCKRVESLVSGKRYDIEPKMQNNYNNRFNIKTRNQSLSVANPESQLIPNTLEHVPIWLEHSFNSVIPYQRSVETIKKATSEHTKEKINDYIQNLRFKFKGYDKYYFVKDYIKDKSYQADIALNLSALRPVWPAQPVLEFYLQDKLLSKTTYDSPVLFQEPQNTSIRNAYNRLLFFPEKQANENELHFKLVNGNLRIYKGRFEVPKTKSGSSSGFRWSNVSQELGGYDWMYDEAKGLFPYSRLRGALDESRSWMGRPGFAGDEGSNNELDKKLQADKYLDSGQRVIFDQITGISQYQGNLYIADGNNKRIRLKASGSGSGFAAGKSRDSVNTVATLDKVILGVFAVSDSELLVNTSDDVLVLKPNLKAESLKAKYGTTFKNPAKVLKVGNDIYIVDTGRHRVLKNGEVIAGTTDKSGYGPQLLNSPSALAVDSKGNLFIGDEGYSGITPFDHSNLYILRAGQKNLEKLEWQSFPEKIQDITMGRSDNEFFVLTPSGFYMYKQ